MLSQLLLRLASNAAASTSSQHLSRELSPTAWGFWSRGPKTGKGMHTWALLSHDKAVLSRGVRRNWAQTVRLLGKTQCRPQSAASLHATRQFTVSRAFHATRETSMPAPVLVPLYVLYSLAKVWIFKPVGMVYKALSVGNAVKAYRLVQGIRNSWEYKMARRIIIGTAVVVTFAGAAILVACDFDDARAAAVIGSIPRTLSTAGWGVHTAWTYKTALMMHSDPHSEEYQAALKGAHKLCADRLSALCGENGGIYVKAAQFIASMQTSPIEYRRALEKLQDQAQPQPFEDARRVLEAELGQPLEEFFMEFEPEAKAAASLAQVHKARLYDGRQVAVKVQYPGLESAVSADLSTLSLLASIAAVVFPDSFDFGWVVKRLGANLEKELDFRIEADNANRLAICMASNPCIAVPKFHSELSTERVLCMEWVEGVKISDRKGMVQLGIRPREAATQLLKAFGEMIYIHGFVHADPHAGNMLVRRRPGKQSWRWLLFGLGWRQPQIVLLDHGLYVKLPEAMRQDYCALWCSFLVNDMTTAALVSRKIAGEQGGRLLPTLLKPGQLVSEEQRTTFKKEAGIEGLGDVGRLIEGLSEEFLQLLRVIGVVRPTARNLGASNSDRMRINASCAHKGLWKAKEDIPATLNSFRSRFYMKLTLDALVALFYIDCIAQELFDTITFLPTKMAHAMYEARYA